MTYDEHRDVETQVERRLARYRPTGPPARLRERVVPRARSRWAWAVAAMLALTAVGLNWSTRAIEQRTAAMLGAGDEPEPPPVDPRLTGLEDAPR